MRRRLCVDTFLTLCAPGGKGHRTLGSWVPLCDPSTSRAWLASFDKLSLATQKSLDKQKGAPARRAFTEDSEICENFGKGQAQSWTKASLPPGPLARSLGASVQISDHWTKERLAQKDAKITRFNRRRSTRGGLVWLGSASCAFGGHGGFPYPQHAGHRAAKRSTVLAPKSFERSFKALKRQAEGLMFWFTCNRLFGSYCFLIRVRRS
jgi:hypothetical protein